MVQAYGAAPRRGRGAPARFVLTLLAGLVAPLVVARAATPPAPVRLLTLGDSLTAGYGLPEADGFEAQLAAALARAGDPVSIVDGGVSGDTSAGGLARLDWVLAGRPQAAIVELGGNDGLRGIDPADMERNLAAILDRLQAAHIPVLLAGMYAPPNLGAEYERQFRAVFDRLGSRPGVLYDPFFLEGVALHPALEQADGIHPNAAGVRIIVARLLPLVERLLGEARRDAAAGPTPLGGTPATSAGGTAEGRPAG